MLKKNVILKRMRKNDLFAKLLKLLMYFEKDNNRKFKLIEHISYYYFIRETGRYSDEFLEKEVIKISNTIHSFRSSQEEKNTTLHVVSHVEEAGGHNYLILNWIRFDASKKHSMVLTKQYNYPIPEFLTDSITASGGRIYNLKNDDRIRQAKQLLEIASGYEKIIVHSHPDDALPLLAFSNHEWTKPIYIMNQANFAFNIWVSIADMVLDISKDDHILSVKYRDCRNAKILRIPMEKKEVTNINVPEYQRKEILNRFALPSGCKVITSMARDVKFTPVEKYNFQDVIKKIVSKYNNVYFIIIGGNRNRDIWKKLIKETKGKVKVVGERSQKEVDEILGITDLYIDSYPISSYTCVLQALDKCIPIATMENGGITPDNLTLMKKNNVDELIEWVDLTLDKKNQEEEMNEIRNRVMKQHWKDDWCKRLENIYQIPLTHKIHKFHSRYRRSDYEKIFCISFQNNYQYEPSTLFTPLERLILKLFMWILNINEREIK